LSQQGLRGLGRRGAACSKCRRLRQRKPCRAS
jgi:hypothetical protein